MLITELITGFFLVVGSIFLFVGSIGLFRLSDFYMRLYGPTKASTIGIGGHPDGIDHFLFSQGNPALLISCGKMILRYRPNIQQC